MPTPSLFEPLTFRSVTFRNRIGVSPMCQYSCEDGLVGDWHLVHLGSRAVGGAGLVMAEATAVSSEDRISPADTEIWKDEHVKTWQRVARFVADHGAVPGVQLAHAGWKASNAPPWRGGKAVPPGEGGWQPLGVGDEPFTEGHQTRCADAIRHQGGIPTAAVGMITDPHQAETILTTGHADMVFPAREMLRDPSY